jgi:hypothetical protein
VFMYVGYIYNIIIFSGSAAQRGLWPNHHTRFLLITYNDAPHSVGLLWTSDQLVAETSTWQNTQQANIHDPGEIRTYDRCRRAALDLRLRPRGHWDWRAKLQLDSIKGSRCMLLCSLAILHSLLAHNCLSNTTPILLCSRPSWRKSSHKYVYVVLFRADFFLEDGRLQAETTGK